MSTLADRLRGIVQATRRPEEIEPRDSDHPSDLEHALGGSWHDGGQCFVVERRVASDRHHGRAQVGVLASQVQRAGEDAELVGILTGGTSAPAPFLFFDLETTGLSGGAGTHAFLVGCGWFDAEGAFVTRQHLLTGYAVERRM